MIINTELDTMDMMEIDNAVRGTVLDFYSAMNSKLWISEMMEAHEEYTNAVNIDIIDEDEVRDCADAIINIYRQAMASEVAA